MSAGLHADKNVVKRRAIQVIKSRLEDVEVGDIVNRNPDAELGWFLVDAISILFNGHIQLADDTEQLTVSGGHKDMVGIQLVEEFVLDERGIIVPPAAAAAPIQVAVPVAPPDAAPVVHATSDPTPGQTAPGQTAEPAPSAPQEAPEVPAALGGPSSPPVDLEAEAAAAAAIATEMDAPTGAAGHAVPGVDLALVASLLENLDVGDAPQISTEISDEPMMAEPAPVIPPNAVAVDGGALPDKPSYKNPIVIPEGGMLPRRSRAA